MKKELILKPVLNFATLKGYFKTIKKYSKVKARNIYLKDILRKSKT